VTTTPATGHGPHTDHAETAATTAAEAAATPTAARTFDALRFRGYRSLWIGSLGVLLAVTGQTIARGWLAFQLTGTNAGLGGVMMGFGLAMLLATPVGGVAADRWPRRAVLVGSIAILVLTAAWIGLAEMFGFLEYWMLVSASALQAIAFAFYGPARMSVIPELVDRPTVPNAIVLGQVGLEGMRVMGPATAGILVATPWFGAEGVFLLGSSLCMVALVATLRLPRTTITYGSRRLAPLADTAEAFRYIRAEPGLLLLATTSLGVVAIGMPYLTFLPAIAEDIFDVGSQGYGVMSATSATGGVVAGLLTARLGERRRPWRRAGLAGLLFGCTLILLAVMPRFGLALAVLPLLGGASLMFQTTNQSLLMTLSDSDYHGRLQGTVMLGFSGFGIVALPLGVLADEIGLRSTLGLMGATVVAIMLVFNLRRRRHRGAALALELG
jgi:MFS family permease